MATSRDILQEVASDSPEARQEGVTVDWGRLIFAGVVVAFTLGLLYFVYFFQFSG